MSIITRLRAVPRRVVRTVAVPFPAPPRGEAASAGSQSDGDGRDIADGETAGTGQETPEGKTERHEVKTETDAGTDTRWRRAGAMTRTGTSVRTGTKGTTEMQVRDVAEQSAPTPEPRGFRPYTQEIQGAAAYTQPVEGAETHARGSGEAAIPAGGSATGDTIAQSEMTQSIMAQSTMKVAIHTPAGPVAGAPYTPAVRVGDMVFVSGQLPVDPATGALVNGGMEAQVRQCLRNLAAVLAEAGLGMGHVVKTTVFLAYLHTFDAFNKAYAESFTGVRPARSTVQVAGLPLHALVEIDAIAVATGAGTEGATRAEGDATDGGPGPGPSGAISPDGTAPARTEAGRPSLLGPMPEGLIRDGAPAAARPI